MRDLTLIATIRVHHPELHEIWTHKALREEILINLEGIIHRMPGAVSNLLSIGRPPWSAIVTWRAGKTSDVGTIDIHGVDIEITILERGEDDPLAIGRDYAFRCVHAVVREPL